ncbi:MAG: hypothetical protein O7D27_08655 [Alphaproteobacteria bacterium]|nr:hypothetical protein [Alphaproteobacteria bacterium]MCZ6742212.1 hypothetical protein [Alphaproteobacteria bacterium]MCZ6813116.1 hypothetical protein [Alphaproteobacteria bacterium]
MARLERVVGLWINLHHLLIFHLLIMASMPARAVKRHFPMEAAGTVHL